MSVERDGIYIFKYAVIGFIVRVQRGVAEYPDVWPIEIDSEGATEVEKHYIHDDDVVAVIPAPPRTYVVYACYDDLDGRCTRLGYEFEGAEHPDWFEEAKEQKRYVELRLRR